MLEMCFLPWDKPYCKLNAGTEYAPLQLLLLVSGFCMFVCLGLFNLCICVCVCLFACTPCVCRCPWEPEDVTSQGTVIIGGCEQSELGARSQTQGLYRSIKHS